MMKCKICGCNDYSIIYELEDIPVFQNKVYDTENQALMAKTGNVKLVRCNKTNIIYNIEFNPELMVYNNQYQNEQNHSQFFKSYLLEILDLIKSKFNRAEKIVEIGCGKGYFIELLREHGFNAIGFDPAYEGESPYIYKSYFNGSNLDIHADVIILRHVLEHIINPFEFIHKVAKSNNYMGRIYIEVPDFEWIVNKGAFWDIFYEHCNYFTKESLSSFFNFSETGNIFNGQYFYLIADLSKLRNKLQTTIKSADFKYNFFSHLKHYKEFIKSDNNLAIWGAGAKGCTFCNIIDSTREKIKCVVDINPKKQNKYIAKTAHKIIPPELINDHYIDSIIIMNENYLNEIKNSINNAKVQIQSL